MLSGGVWGKIETYGGAGLGGRRTDLDWALERRGQVDGHCEQTSEVVLGRKRVRADMERRGRHRVHWPAHHGVGRKHIGIVYRGVVVTARVRIGERQRDRGIAHVLHPNE